MSETKEKWRKRRERLRLLSVLPRGDMGPVLGDPVECTRVKFGETELGPGKLYASTPQDVELRIQITDHRGRVLVVGRLASIKRDEKDGSITLEFEPVTQML